MNETGESLPSSVSRIEVLPGIYPDISSGDEPQNINPIAATVLPIASVAAYVGERHNYYAGLGYGHPHLTEVMNSMGHPALGFYGGVAGEFVARMGNSSRRMQLAASFVGATIFNFFTEYSQQVLTAPSYKFWEHSETLKDYAFALGGLAIYRLTSHKKTKKPDAT